MINESQIPNINLKIKVNPMSSFVNNVKETLEEICDDIHQASNNLNTNNLNKTQTPFATLERITRNLLERNLQNRTLLMNYLEQDIHKNSQTQKIILTQSDDKIKEKNIQKNVIQTSIQVPLHKVNDEIIQKEIIQTTSKDIIQKQRMKKLYNILHH